MLFESLKARPSHVVVGCNVSACCHEHHTVTSQGQFQGQFVVRPFWTFPRGHHLAVRVVALAIIGDTDGSRPEILMTGD